MLFTLFTLTHQANLAMARIGVGNSAIATLTSARLWTVRWRSRPSEPGLDQEDRPLDLRLVPRPSRPGRQNGTATLVFGKVVL
jgi:hypothetical protein